MIVLQDSHTPTAVNIKQQVQHHGEEQYRHQRVLLQLNSRRQSQDAEIREAFALFDKRGTGAIPRESLGDLLRALGQNPTQAEVAELASQNPRDSGLRLLGLSVKWPSRVCCPSTVDYDTFTGILHRPDGYKSAGSEGGSGLLWCSMLVLHADLASMPCFHHPYYGDTLILITRLASTRYT